MPTATKSLMPGQERSAWAICAPVWNRSCGALRRARRTTATIVVKAPKTSLTTAATLSVKLYKLKPGGANLEKITPETVSALKTANRLEMLTELPAAKLAPQIKEKGKHLEIKHP